MLQINYLFSLKQDAFNCWKYDSKMNIEEYHFT